MIEVCLSFDFIRGFDDEVYSKWTKKAIVVLLKSPGIIEFRAHRNLFGSPLVRLTSDWAKLSDWARFAESPEWLALMDELRRFFAQNIAVCIWGASPIAPEPLRPSR
ncbi:MAG: hypothetical protein JW932_09310 [Deltaproteobacteria bacterium]|nr:hypothetical protein [Deltaproteobacteria bacterium]